MITKKNINEKLEEINRYFVNKILRKDFEYIDVQKADVWHLKIRIDGYYFEIWMQAPNKPQDNYWLRTHFNDGICNRRHKSLMHLNFSQSEKNKIGRIILKIYEEKKAADEEKKDREEYERLKNKFNNEADGSAAGLETGAPREGK